MGSSKPYLEGHGDLVCRLVIRITRLTIRVIEVIRLLAKSPYPPSIGPVQTLNPKPTIAKAKDY